jgi:CheY-specific phosphatase CheX
MGVKKFVLDDNVVNEIIIAVKETFFHSLAEEIEFISTEDTLEVDFDFYGIVGLEQIDNDNYSEGIMKCEFKKDLIFYMLKKLYQKEIDDIDRSSIHCAGEFTNIIYTRVKSLLNEKLGYAFKMAVPAVTLGNDDEAYPISEGKCLDKYINFMVKDVPFCVHLKIRSGE